MQSSLAHASRAGSTTAWFLAVVTVSGTAVAVCRARNCAAAPRIELALAERRAEMLDIEAEAIGGLCVEPVSRIRALAVTVIAEENALDPIDCLTRVRAALEQAESGGFSFEHVLARFVELARGEGLARAGPLLAAELAAALEGEDEHGLVAES